MMRLLRSRRPLAVFRRLPGFTLVELTVGALIFSIIMGAAFLLLIRYGQVSARGEAASEALNWGRTAIAKIADDVRQARYLYHYTRVTFETGLKVGGVDISYGLPDSALTYPLVTAGPFIGGAVPGYTDLAGIGGLRTSSVTMMTGSLSEPKYITWLQHPGPANPATVSANDKKTYGGIYYRLIRVEMKCGEYKAGSTQGAWLDMTAGCSADGCVPWTRFGNHPASRSAIVFVASDKTVGNQACTKSMVQVYGQASNPATSPPFFWENRHPYSAEGPMSPYWVSIALQMGDPFNNLLRTGANSGVQIAPDWFIQAVTLKGAAYAQNVTMPGAL